jgi:hypothetical protein
VHRNLTPRHGIKTVKSRHEFIKGRNVGAGYERRLSLHAFRLEAVFGSRLWQAFKRIKTVKFANILEHLYHSERHATPPCSALDNTTR